MEYKYSNEKIWLEDENGKEIAYVEFPEKEENIVDIQHTVVDDSLRGKGIAGELMKNIAEYLKKNNKKAIPSCSYAKKWFSSNEDYKDLIAE